MVKKWRCLFVVIMVAIGVAAYAESNDDWMNAPIITHAYEIDSGKLYLEWEGSAPVYQVYLDGVKAQDVNVSNAVIELENGTHQLQVYPVYEIKAADTKLELNLVKVNIGIDLAALGLDPKDMMAGTPSAMLTIDYVASTIFEAAPDRPEATTDFDDVVSIIFTDRYYADEYIISIKAGDDVNYVKFSNDSEAAQELLQKKGTTVTVKLLPEYLEAQKCIVPELDSEYVFSVQLRKHIEDYITSEVAHDVIHSSKDSTGLRYTPIAAWKNAPDVYYASQTADGQVTIQWNHDDNGLGCAYKIMRSKKSFGIKTGEEEVGTTSEKQIVIDDLMNGNFEFTIVPVLLNETGVASEEGKVNIQNEWVAAPMLSCKEESSGSVKLSWDVHAGVAEYHVIVYKGDSESLLRFVNLDFSQYSEVSLQAEGSQMEYTFAYEGDIDSEVGERFKFEVYGLRHAANGEEQKSSVSSQIIVMH